MASAMTSDTSTWTPETGKPEIPLFRPRKADTRSALYPPLPPRGELRVTCPLLPLDRAP